MNFIETKIPDVIIIETKVFTDDRGYFFESFRQDQFQEKVGKINFVQENESYSTYGSLRGLHYQLPPFAQSKLVRVVKGSVLDIAVDIRKSSPTFGQCVSLELNDVDKKQLFIPQGFAHGFITLSENAIFQYKVDNYYNKESERGIIYNDKELGIDWKIPEGEMKLSDKDKQLRGLEEAELFD